MVAVLRNTVSSPPFKEKPHNKTCSLEWDNSVRLNPPGFTDFARRHDKNVG